MSVTAAAGFRAAGVRAGLRAQRPGQATPRPDLALVVNDGPSTTAAGVFTRNQVKAAPVLWSQQVLVERSLRAVVLNAGGANACTGPDGFADTHHTAERVAAALDVGAIDVAVCSTGLIGERLPIADLLTGVDAAAAALGTTARHGTDAATSVLTTDTVDKQSARTRDGWTVGGFAKGAGMMAPSLATMLVVLTTDARLDPAAADAALRAATAVTFDRLDVDGATSTNDTVLLLASGASDVAPEPDAFTAELTAVCAELCRGMQADAEGVTKRISVTVRTATDDADALVAARAIARDSLVKTALFGSDPNWGRIAAAVGGSDARVDPQSLDVTVNDVLLCRAAAAVGDRHAADLSGPDVVVEVALGLGEGTATVLTTDLSHAYVEENSAYSS